MQPIHIHYWTIRFFLFPSQLNHTKHQSRRIYNRDHLSQKHDLSTLQEEMISQHFELVSFIRNGYAKLENLYRNKCSQGNIMQRINLLNSGQQRKEYKSEQGSKQDKYSIQQIFGQQKRCFTSSKIREGIFLNLPSYSSLRQEEYHMKFSNKTRLINVSNTPRMIRIHPESDSQRRCHCKWGTPPEIVQHNTNKTWNQTIKPEKNKQCSSTNLKLSWYLQLTYIHYIQKLICIYTLPNENIIEELWSH